jgi:hypothetical protein
MTGKKNLTLLALMARNAPPMPQNWITAQPKGQTLVQTQAQWSAEWAKQTIAELQTRETPTEETQPDQTGAEAFSAKNASADCENEADGQMDHVQASLEAAILQWGLKQPHTETSGHDALPLPPDYRSQEPDKRLRGLDDQNDGSRCLLWHTDRKAWSISHGSFTLDVRFASTLNPEDAMKAVDLVAHMRSTTLPPLLLAVTVSSLPTGMQKAIADAKGESQ